MLRTTFFLTVCLVCARCGQQSVQKSKQPVDFVSNQQKTLTITGLQIPDWLEGGWQNLAESNTQRFEYLTFENGNFYFSSKAVDSNQTLQGKVTANADSVCRISWQSQKGKMECELKLQQTESVPQETVLSYSLSENGEVIRPHFTSCNLVFNRIEMP